MHQPRHISVAPHEKLVTIRSQNECICAAESNPDKISWPFCRYGASEELIFRDEEVGFGIVCPSASLELSDRYVVIYLLYVSSSSTILNKQKSCEVNSAHLRDRYSHPVRTRKMLQGR